MVEKLLPEFYPLHSGLTTGTCATAAAVAATTRLLKGETPPEVPVILPNGETITVPVGYTDGYAYCTKEAGDDPDVTNGLEIRATVEEAPHFEITAGTGVGRFTLPGFDYPPGEPAINKAPRQMLGANLAPLQEEGKGLRVTISVPQGETIARKTFNPRLGIEGGISIIGVSGIVKPFSEEAFIESIRKCMEVAKASGTDRIVLHSGMKSEGFLQQRYPNLPQQAFVEYGNAIGATLQIANELDIPRIALGIMLGKAVKLAEGHLDTHSKKQTMNKAFIAEMLKEAGCKEEIVKVNGITLARELWGIIPSEQIETFCRTVIRHCLKHCEPLLPHGELIILLIDDGGGIH
jgi:cobalt-precorrin-5B (C1)-methyltransferase